LRLVACNLPCSDAAPYTVAIIAATMALCQRHVRQAQQHTYRAQKKNPFHLYKPFPFKFCFVTGGNFGLTAACTRTVGERVLESIPLLSLATITPHEAFARTLTLMPLKC
jgi:hypothetical protein